MMFGLSNNRVIVLRQRAAILMLLSSGKAITGRDEPEARITARNF
jgi:hypothetical protein